MSEYKVPEGILRKQGANWVPCGLIINGNPCLLIDNNQYAKTIYQSHRQEERIALGIKEVVRKNFDSTLFRQIGETVEETNEQYIITPVTEALINVEGKRTELLAQVENELMDNYGAKAIARRLIYIEFSKTGKADAMTDYLAALKLAWVQDIRPSLQVTAAPDYVTLIANHKIWTTLLPEFPE